jgi:hypothetical protein
MVRSLVAFPGLRAIDTQRSPTLLPDLAGCAKSSFPGLPQFPVLRVPKTFGVD